MCHPGCSKHLPTSSRKFPNLKFLNIWNNWFFSLQISNVSISEKCKNPYIFKIFRKLVGKCLELSERRTLYFRMGFIVKVSKEPIIIQPFHFVMMIFTFSGCPGSMEKQPIFMISQHLHKLCTGFWTQNEGGFQSTGSISGHSQSIFRHGEIKTRNYNLLYGYFHYRSHSKIKHVSPWLL